MPALLTRTSIGSEIGFDFLQTLGAGLVGRHVPLEHCDAGFGFEFLRRFVIAGVVGRHFVAGRLQRLGNGGADAAGTAGHNCYACHDLQLLPPAFPSLSCPAAAETSDALYEPMPPARVTRSRNGSLTLHAHGNAHAAADAQRGEAFLGIALLHFVEQRHEHARA